MGNPLTWGSSLLDSAVMSYQNQITQQRIINLIVHSNFVLPGFYGKCVVQ